MTHDQAISMLKQVLTTGNIINNHDLIQWLYDNDFCCIGSGAMADVFAYNVGEHQFAVRIATDYEGADDGYAYFHSVINQRMSFKHVTETYWHYNDAGRDLLVTVMPLYKDVGSTTDNYVAFLAADAALGNTWPSYRDCCTLETMIPRLKWQFARYLRQYRKDYDDVSQYRILIEKYQHFIIELWMLYQETDKAPGCVGFDFHSGNVMTDPRDGRIVITDPYC